MSFFAMPAWQPPSGYQIPAWLRPPETMVPGIVPVELLLAETDTDAVLVTDLRAYPTGLEFALTGRLHPDQLHQRRHDPDRPHRFMYRDLWPELRFADGQTASTHPRSWPQTFETEQPDPPFLYCHGGGGSEHGWRSPHWLWGLPRRGRSPSCAPGLPANSQPRASRSTPTWSWRPPTEPSGSGRRAKDNHAAMRLADEGAMTWVMVTGRLRQRSWETPEGDKRSVTELEADEVGASLKWEPVVLQPAA